VAASGRRHPIDLKRHEVATFLSRLASRDRVSASTQIQASCALSFLFRKVLGRSMVEGLPRARPRGSRRVPSVLSHQEVEGVLAMLRGPSRLMAALLYGAGLRLGECCRLQVQDLDLESRQVFVRGGKGAKDRTTLLPERLVEPLRGHLARIHRIYLEDAWQGVRGVQRRPPPRGAPTRAGRRVEEAPSPLESAAAGAGDAWGRRGSPSPASA
jgi:integrase